MASPVLMCISLLLLFSYVTSTLIRDVCDLKHQPDKITCLNSMDLEAGPGQLVVERLELNRIVRLNIHPGNFLELSHIIITESDLTYEDHTIQEFLEAAIIVIIDERICKKLSTKTYDAKTRSTSTSSSSEPTTVSVHEEETTFITSSKSKPMTVEETTTTITLFSTTKATVEAEWENIVGVLSTLTLLAFVVLIVYCVRKVIRKWNRRTRSMFLEETEIEEGVVYTVPVNPVVEQVRRRSLPKSHEA